MRLKAYEIQSPYIKGIIMTNKLFQYLTAGVLLVLWSILYPFLPWYELSFLLLLFVFTLMILAKPSVAAYILVLLIPIFSNRLGFYFSQTHIGMYSTKILPFHWLFLILGCIALFLRKMSKLHTSVIYKNPLSLSVVIALVFYAIVSLWWAPSYNYGRVVIMFMIANFMLYYFIVNVIEDELTHKHIMVVWVFTGIVISILIILSFYKMPASEFYYKKITDWLTFVFNNTTEVKYRGHAFGHPNHSSATLDMSIFVTMGLLLVEISRKRRTFYVFALLLMVFANILTGSKGGVGSLVLGMLFLSIASSTIRRNWFKNIGTAFIVCLVVLVLALTYSSFKRRTPRLLKTSYRGKTVSLEYRFDIWNAGLVQMKRRHDVWKGLGAGGFEKTTIYPHSHNFFLSFFFDYGIAGILFALFLYLRFFIAFLRFLKGNPVQDNYYQVMSLVLMAGTITFAIHSTVDHYYSKSVAWLLLAATVATLKLVRKDMGSLSAYMETT